MSSGLIRIKLIFTLLIVYIYNSQGADFLFTSLFFDWGLITMFFEPSFPFLAELVTDRSPHVTLVESACPIPYVR
jgi:hypothetical protein